MKDINELTGAVLGAAVQVHKELGPGLLESKLDSGYRLDLLIDERVVVEVKSVASLDAIFTAQVLTYLKLGGYEVGLLINFNVKYLGEGAIRRLVSGYKGVLPRVPRVPR